MTDRFTMGVRGLLILAALLLAITAVSFGHSFAANGPGDGHPRVATAEGGSPVLVTVIDGLGPGQIAAYDANGTLQYRNTSHRLYHDVDPHPAGPSTVVYVASSGAPPSSCAADKCLRNVIERLNLRTGAVERLYSWVHPRNGSTQIHDVDRVNGSVYVVGDITHPDEVFAIDIETGERRWTWRVEEAFDPSSGGQYPGDWTHLNDVEVLPDGRVMVNLRNQDQVVFIEPGEGIQPGWTLGRDDAHDILFEPHNPDYIPAERGGPAVVIADSENNRLVEYQRVDGDWEQAWVWQDTTLRWPRDADRLPSGRTLAVDSHGKRLLSIAPNGSIAWQKSVPRGAYDVELLGTGDESTGGASAASLNLTSRSPDDTVADGVTTMNRSVVGPSLGPVRPATPEGPSSVSDRQRAAGGDGLGDRLRFTVVSAMPPRVLHGLLFVLPDWTEPIDAALLLVTGAVLLPALPALVANRYRRR